MATPAVIIGLGGTGQWVTTYIKKELIEDYGAVPSNVRLLVFDTWPDTNIGQEPVNAQIVTIGNIRLEKDREFFPLSGDTYNWGELVVKDGARHIGQRISDQSEVYAWFDAPYFRQNVSRGLWHLNIGAGAIRQFGRLGFFNHATLIKTILTNTFAEIARNNKDNIKTQVFIISSFAGGTGAGMFLDMALNVRSLMGNLGPGGAFIRGIFVLPGAFGASRQTPEGQQMQARAYAAWRELARFMNLGPEFGSHIIRYDDHTQILVNSKPFDQVFLIDAKRPKHTFVGEKPENGVFPSVATFVSTVLDDEGGQQIGDAVNKIANQHNNKLGFSTFGAYAVQQPISHLKSEYALQTARDLLDRWLSPEYRIEGETHIPIGLKFDQNLERPGQRGAQELVSFMTAQKHELRAVLNRANPQQPNPSGELQSLRLLGDIYEKYQAHNTGTLGNRIDEAVQGGYARLGADGGVEPTSWLGSLLIPADYDKTEIIGLDGKPQPINSQSLSAEVRSSVRSEVPTSRDSGVDPSYDEAQRIKVSVENDQNGYIVRHYGKPGGRGTFDAELDVLVKFNVARFKQILEYNLLNLLNGTVIDIQRGFLGRLGYVEDFLRELLNALEWYQKGFIKPVVEKRGEQQMLQSVENTMSAAASEMFAHAGRKCLFFFNHPRAYMKQEDYIEAAQSYCEVRKDDKVISAVDRVVSGMKETVHQALDQIVQWKQTLILGDLSLYQLLESEYEEVKQDLDKLQRANKAQKILVHRNYPKEYKQNSEVIHRIDNQLSRLRWMVNLQEGLNISCEMYRDETGYYEALVRQPDRNKDLFKQAGIHAWGDFVTSHFLLDEIGARDSDLYQDPVSLGDELIGKSTPMYDSHVVGAGILSAFRRASKQSQRPGFDPNYYLHQVDALQSRIVGLNPMIGYNTIDSSNPHKLALIQCVDRLSEKDFEAYYELQMSYQQQIRGAQNANEVASRLHIFPAECNTAFYENKLPQWLSKNIRELSPRVMLLLTEVQKVRLFFICYALGMIVHGTKLQHPGHWWRLIVPAGPGVHAHDILFYDSDEAYEPDLFDVINRFVAGKDIRTGNPIIWDSVKLIIHQMIGSNGRAWFKQRIDAMFDDRVGELASAEYSLPGLMVEERRRMIVYMRNMSARYWDDYVAQHGEPPEENPGWRWVRTNDMEDLCDVAKMMYIETLLTNSCIQLEDLRGSFYIQ